MPSDENGLEKVYDELITHVARMRGLLVVTMKRQTPGVLTPTLTPGCRCTAGLALDRFALAEMTTLVTPAVQFL